MKAPNAKVSPQDSAFRELAREAFASAQASAEGLERGFRERAWAGFERMGFPDTQTETWRYSNSANLRREAWQIPQSGSRALALPEWLEKLAANFTIIQTINGELTESASGPGWKAEQLSLREEVPPFQVPDGWAGLSAAVARPGIQLSIAARSRIEKPILLIHRLSGERAFAPSLHVIDVDAGAEVELAEVYLSEATGLRSDLCTVTVGVNGRLKWLRVQAESEVAQHFSQVEAYLNRDSAIEFSQFHSGSAWCRSTFRADLDGSGSEAVVNGLTFAAGQQHIDQRVEVRHLKGPGTSSQLFKGVLKDRARGVVNGKIYIAQDAQKVISNQLIHNLLLSAQAEANTKPELEVYADDVKANHGASIGQIDEEKMFYLMSRGITRADAQRILATAFVGDVVMKISSPCLRAVAEARIEAVLPAFARDLEAHV